MTSPLDPEMRLRTSWFDVYAVGLVHASVCTDLPLDEATARLNLEYPTGVGPWHPSDDPKFLSGLPNPNPCDRNPDRLHWLFSC